MPGLRRFVDEVDQPIRLAFSLHAADPTKRSELMPVNDRYPLADVLAECRRYVELRRRKVFVEYVMLAGVNDSRADATALAAALDSRAFKVNLIHVSRLPVQGQPDPLQPDRPGYDGSAARRSRGSRRCSTGRGVPATVRLTRGRDIEAACGQLAATRS